jgi:hypothetical protein|tara:strand:+ start:416 stop:526 length:111 start_codon:yes stop_codon:yes gene_type:complete
MCIKILISEEVGEIYVEWRKGEEVTRFMESRWKTFR